MKRNTVYFKVDDFGYNIPCPWDGYDCEFCPHNPSCEELAGLIPNWWDSDEEVEVQIAESVVEAHKMGYHCAELANRVSMKFAEKMGWD